MPGEQASRDEQPQHGRHATLAQPGPPAAAQAVPDAVERMVGQDRVPLPLGVENPGERPGEIAPRIGPALPPAQVRPPEQVPVSHHQVLAYG